MKCDIGLIGLAVMGENLVINMENSGFSVCVFNRDTAKVDRFVNGRAAGRNILGAQSLEQLVASLKAPRKIMLMIKAGNAVDAMIGSLIPLLDKGDIIIDGGNSNYQDTNRRAELVENAGLYYIGAGVSGGEEGALNGPSIMPGGSQAAWPLVAPIFQSICAKVDGQPCCQWLSGGGSGHFVKMVHNGIEYGDMQLICEAYAIMRDLLGLDAQSIGEIFADWNKGRLSSYLIEITANIFTAKAEDGMPLVDKIQDTAGQKGTGKWTGFAALELGVPLTLITDSVFARCLSAMKNERVNAAARFKKVQKTLDYSPEKAVLMLENALYAAKIVSYAQGYALLKAANTQYGWDLKLSQIAKIWRGGCIIRSGFLDDIAKAYKQTPELENLMLAGYFKNALGQASQDFRAVVALGVLNGTALPAMSAALAYFDGYKTARLPANLLQAQRDYFGAHQFERTDKNPGEFFHFNWTGKGGETASSEYSL